MQLDDQIEVLEADIEFYETLEHDRELLQQLNTNPEALDLCVKISGCTKKAKQPS